MGWYSSSRAASRWCVPPCPCKWAVQRRGGSQRLREWCYGTDDKKGHKRRELDVSTCFAPLLQWILSLWPADQPRLALALDATALKKRGTRAGDQRGVSRLCDSRGVGRGGGLAKGRLATVFVWSAPPPLFTPTGTHSLRRPP